MEKPSSTLPRILEETRRHWALMSVYERFEEIVVITLSFVVAVLVAIAMLQLMISMVPLVFGGAVNVLDHRVFQELFGAIMTLLIALEFKHSIMRPGLRHDSIVQVKAVVLIALLALSRKFLILDLSETDASTIAALAVAVLVLGIVYWLLRDRDDRSGDPLRGERRGDGK